MSRKLAAAHIAMKLRDLEPFVPAYNVSLARVLQANGQHQASIPILEAIPPTTTPLGAGGQTSNLFLAKAYAAAGRYGEAADALLAMRGDVSQQSMEDVRSSSGARQPLPNRRRPYRCWRAI